MKSFEGHPRTEAGLQKDLATIGVAHGMTLLVHSSLSSVGWVVGGAPTVVRALLSVLGESGTLVMPAATPHGTDPSTWSSPRLPEAWLADVREHLPVFDARTDPYRHGHHMRKLPHLARHPAERSPGGVRLVHAASPRPQLSANIPWHFPKVPADRSRSFTT